MSAEGLDTMSSWLQHGVLPGVAFVRREPTADQKTFDDDFGPRKLPFPVVRDTSMKVANALGASVYPTFVLLDKDARIRYRGKMPSQSDLRRLDRKLSAESWRHWR